MINKKNNNESQVPPLAEARSFIEVQFPISKVSMESYKERKAGASQTLTGLGKWWGRKPLVLIRAALLGLLMPTSEDPEKDREIFLKLMTMDDNGLWRRKNKSIPKKRLIHELKSLPPSLRRCFLDSEDAENPDLSPGLLADEKKELQRIVFNRMPYSEKLNYCSRPEQIDGPSPQTWEEINKHLGTEARSLPELIEMLGQRRFGKRPSVGDSFCGAGSIPFEGARLGCDVYGSDLSPVAALLTWAALNIVGGGQEIAEKVQEVQKMLYKAVDQQISEWGIEHNDKGWRADAYLYCVEVKDPESGRMIPLAPSWVIGEKTKTVAKLVPDLENNRYSIEIHENVSERELVFAQENGTVKNSRLVPPDGGHSTPIEVIRRDLRMWQNEDIVPRPEDVFQERLYCIRWVETYYEKKIEGKIHILKKSEAENLPDFSNLIDQGVLKRKIRRHYKAPTVKDFEREQLVLHLIKERFVDWQKQGFIPSRKIEPGDKTDEPIRTRGWTYWHHLFNPRQLLILGMFSKNLKEYYDNPISARMLLLGLSRITDWTNRLCRWDSSRDEGKQNFANQALNTLYNYSCRALEGLDSYWNDDYKVMNSFLTKKDLLVIDAKQVKQSSDIWISDPPYADAVNYHELSEFFICWYEKHLTHIFPQWYTDSKRALAVKGDDENFRKAMVECYRRLVECMPDNGLQIVMFTHQDAAVWADLSLILWAAGLRVTAAWCIATETDSALKQGNYVQGTVLLVCRKRISNDPIFLDELAHKVELEVKRQLDSMMAIEDESDPNFGDSDYQLAAYAAALRVLTERPLEDIDPAREISRFRLKGEKNPLEKLIQNAVKIACDHLVPKGVDSNFWKLMMPMERFYIKGLEVESHGEYRNGVYQELARGFGALDYSDLLADTKANQTRLKTASEFGKRNLSGQGFGQSLMRHVLFAAYQVVKNESTVAGLNWLRTEISDYWGNREKIVQLLDYLAFFRRVSNMEHWWKDSEAAQLLAGAVRNDHI